RPGGLGDRSGGEAHYIDTLAPAGVAAGVHGLFMEVHPNPARALSDGPNSYRLDRLEALLGRLLAIHAATQAGSRMGGHVARHRPQGAGDRSAGDPTPR